MPLKLQQNANEPLDSPHSHSPLFSSQIVPMTLNPELAHLRLPHNR